MLEKFLAAWCRTMHDAAMWPMHGKYVCRQCLREHPVEWEGAKSLAPRPPRAARAASASMDVCA
ncbi:MAG TPA: hypothetical protein VKE70_29155 [Candidatus Solibacter sp.]|nr:hypothetical protein [Candidatus Solibacter sp.]